MRRVVRCGVGPKVAKLRDAGSAEASDTSLAPTHGGTHARRVRHVTLRRVVRDKSSEISRQRDKSSFRWLGCPCGVPEPVRGLSLHKTFRVSLQMGEK
eukprot:2606882-Pyramimonas_sp.AAC.1